MERITDLEQRALSQKARAAYEQLKDRYTFWRDEDGNYFASLTGDGDIVRGLRQLGNGTFGLNMALERWEMPGSV